VLVEPADATSEVKAYADALERLIDDPAARRQMGQAARARVAEHFRLDQMIDGFVAAVAHARQLRATRRTPPLSPVLATSWAEQAVEYLRVSRLAEALWHAQPHVTSTRATAGTQLHDAAWLEQVEGAGSWRVARRLHESALGRLMRRLGLSSDHAAIARIESPARRRAAIERSRSYRLIRATKSSALHRAYARIRYGRREGRRP
jgi:hypothetical protein